MPIEPDTELADVVTAPRQLRNTVNLPVVRESQRLHDAFNPPFARIAHQMQKLGESLVPPFVRKLQRLPDALNPPVARIAHQMQKLGESLVPPLIRELQRLHEGLERTNKWFAEAPGRLRAALQDEAVFPHPDLDIRAWQAVLASFEEAGPQGAIAKLDELHEQLFSTEHFRAELAQRWSSSKRRPILTHILEAHDTGLYGVAIPAAIAQAEGLVAEAILAGSGPRWIRQREIARYARQSLGSADPMLLPALSEFCSKLFEPFKHGAPDSGSLRRHSVMHGGSWSYGTHANSLRALLWLDFVLISTAGTEESRDA